MTEPQTEREQVYEYLHDLADGRYVWCSFFEQEARTADGFCQYCGSTAHEPLEEHSEAEP